MTAQVTIHKDANVTLEVIDGLPPVDQTAQVAKLTQDLADMTVDRDRLAAQIAKAQPLANATAAALA